MIALACVKRPSPSTTPRLLSTDDDIDALIAATTPEQIERIVAAWTRQAEQEADALLAPIRPLAERGDIAGVLEAVRSLLLDQSLEMRRVKSRERLSSRLRFGRSSEKLEAEELKTAYLAFDGETGPDGEVPACPEVPTPPADGADVDTDTAAELGLSEPAADGAASEPPQTSDSPEPKKRHGGGGRRALSEMLKRVETPVRVPEAERPCALCGLERTCVGHRQSVKLEYVPGHVEVHVEKRELLACIPCRKDMGAAPREEPKRKVRAAPSFLAELLILKCDDALPLNRVREQLLRLGIDLPMSTIGRWWDYATSLLGPLADVIVGRILADPYMAVDDTGLLYLKPTDKGKKRPAAKGHLWCLMGQGPLVGFRFTETWAAEDIAIHLALAEGFVQGDGYAGYGAEVDARGYREKLIPDDRRLACLMHARRPFHELVVAKDVRANPALLLIQSIYKLEAEYREKGLDHAARGCERLARSLPLFDKLAAWVHQLAPRLRPKDPLAKAVGYFMNQEPFLRRCFTDGRFELDTGRVERAIREVAIGRKNFVLSGSPAGAQRLAVAYTVIESARRALGTERLRPYLIDVISRLEAGLPIEDLRILPPDRWAAEKAAQHAPGNVGATAEHDCGA